MSDAYGVLTFAKSENAEVDTKNLISALNEYSWDNWGGMWIVDMESGEICYSIGKTQYPTIFPHFDKEYIFLDPASNTQYSRPADEVSNEDALNIWDIISDNVPLSELAEKFSKFIVQGYIELSYTSSEKHYHLEWGSMRIESTGKAARFVNCSTPDESFSESYPA